MATPCPFHLQCGLILRVFEQLFARIGEEEQSKGLDRLRYSVKCSFLEIYNEVKAGVGEGCSACAYGW